MSDLRGTRDDDVREARNTDDIRIERERIGVHNEAQPIRLDRVRWGPIWAGLVTAVGAYLFLQLGLVAAGIVDLSEGVTGDVIASAVAALIAFFLGGVVTGATAMWQGVDDGVLHGVVMWFTALVVLVLLSAFGSGLALGAFDTSDTFDQFTTDDVDVDQANEDAEEAAGKALLGLTLGLAAAAAGGAVGSKVWPKDDVFIETTRVRRGRD